MDSYYGINNMNMRQRNPTNIQMAQNLTIDGPQMYLWLKIPAGSKTTTFTVLWDVGEYHDETFISISIVLVRLFFKVNFYIYLSDL